MSKKMAIVLILILALVQEACFLPSAHSSTYTDTDKAFAFLTEVIQLDLTQYQPVVKHAGPINNSYIINMSLVRPSSMEPSTETEVYIQLAPDIHLSPVGTSAGFHCIMWFSKGTPFYFSISGANMTMHYTHTQPSTALDTTKEMLQRYQIYLTQYCGVDGGYLQPMLTMLDNVSEPASTVQISGNVQMKIDYSSGLKQIYGTEKSLVTKTDIGWVYTYNGINVDRKHVTLDFPNGTISHFMDTWNMLTVGSWNMISKQEAISMAFSAAQDVTLKFGNDSGQTYEIKPELSNSASASLSMLPRSNNELYPFWYIEIPFVKSYGDVVGIQAGIWADTKEIVYCQEMGYLGPQMPYDSNLPAFSLTPLTTDSKASGAQAIGALNSTENPPIPEIWGLGILLLVIIFIVGFIVLKRRKHHREISDSSHTIPTYSLPIFLQLTPNCKKSN